MSAKPYNNAVIERSHDVRTLRSCHACKGIGNVGDMVERTLSSGYTACYHGRCYIKRFGEKRFFALPRTETDKMRLDDIGVKRMKRLVGTWR
jgi:hypothetical protein